MEHILPGARERLQAIEKEPYSKPSMDTSSCLDLTTSAKAIASPMKNMFSSMNNVADRFAGKETFTLDEGVEYMQRHLQMSCSVKGSPELDYIKTHISDFEWALRCPTMVEILCEFTSKGLLKLHDVENLTLIRFLKKIEEYNVMPNENVSTEHSNDFYKLSLGMLLKNEIKIDQTLIGSAKPYSAFLRKDSPGGANCEFSIKKGIYHDYFASKGVIEHIKSFDPDQIRGLLLHRCADLSTRNVLQMTCAYIAEYEQTLLSHLTFIIRACLILQVEEPHSKLDSYSKGLRELGSKIRQTLTHEIVLNDFNTVVEVVRNASKRIDTAFSEDARQLQKSGWFLHGFNLKANLPDSNLYEFIAGCLKHCPPSVQEDICTDTTHRLLPCTVLNVPGESGKYDYHVVPVSSVRWAVIREKGIQRHIFAWCPKDVNSALTTQMKKQAPLSLFIHFTESSRLWGPPPKHMWSRDEWWGVLTRAVIVDNVEHIDVFTDFHSQSSPLAELLAQVQKTITNYDMDKAKAKRKHSFVAWYGQVSEKDLTPFLQWAGDRKVTVGMYFPTVLINSDRHEMTVGRLDAEIKEAIKTSGPSGTCHSVTFKTFEGKTVLPSKDDLLESITRL